MAEFARELENPCGSIPRSRPRFGEGRSDEGAVACIASLGKGLLDPGDGMSAD
jgi:hypothetical protein